MEHPRFDLVGLYVYGEDKAGRDAGDLCGAPATGVLATRSIDDILALDADCVLYMPRLFDLDEVVTLLASGLNVVTTRGEFHRPASLDESMLDRIEEACNRGRSSIHSTGSSPGFITEAVPLVLTSLQRRLDRLVIDEFADVSSRNSPELLFDIMGFGKPLAEFDANRLAHLRGGFGPSLWSLADALSIPIEGIEAIGEFATARETFDIAAGRVEAGTVAAQRITVSATKVGEPVVQFRANWYCGTDIAPAWPLRETGWRLSVQGDTPMDVDIRFPVPIERWAETSPGLTAHRAVNAVPYVCDAAPGIRTTAMLPNITAFLGPTRT